MSMSSLPPTEVADVSNDSLFSDSVEFDRAQKPHVEEDEAAAAAAAAADEAVSNGHGDAAATAADGGGDGATPNGHARPSADRRRTSETTRLDDAAEQAPPPVTTHMKPRLLATRQPQQWREAQLRVPDDDPDDEFDLATVQHPVYVATEEDGGDGDGSVANGTHPGTSTTSLDRHPAPASNSGGAGSGKHRITFLHGEPDARGDVTNCFDEPGLLYRIVDKKNRIWAFYNDSLTFEVHITCTFGKHSKLEALDNTRLSRTEADEYVAEVVVYPCETERFVKGFVNGFSSKLRAVPLSNEYYAARTQQQWDGTIKGEVEAIHAAVAKEYGGNGEAAVAAALADDEAILRVCLAHQLPFVDLTFPPTQASLDVGALRPLKRLPWARPRMFVAPEVRDQVRLFRQPVVPGNVAEGELGDCWLMCAIATIAESPQTIMRLFRHPRGAEAGRRERAVGAYRVTVNKNGLWRSVLVDDYLPVVANTPKFAHGTDACELWPAILQKAYAKLHGSYAAIQAGDPIHALTDLTGCLSMRFDDEFVQATTTLSGSGGDGATPTAHAASSSPSYKLFERLMRWHGAGHHIIVTTPGKAPAVIVDGAQHKTLDFSDEPELMQRLAGTGLLPGHAYTVLSVRHFAKEHVQLVCLRRAWDYGVPASGEWSATSPLWTQHAAIAASVQHDPADKTVMWLPWETVLRHCNGGGVCFCGRLGSNGDDAVTPTKPAAAAAAANSSQSNGGDGGNGGAATGPVAAYDYRVPVTFADGKPSVVFALHVTQPTQLCLTLSNMDNRTLLGNVNKVNGASTAAASPTATGMANNGSAQNGSGDGSDGHASAAAAAMAAAAAAAAEDASVVDYPPIMLSLCTPSEDEAATYDVVLNTAADVLRPSGTRWTFLQAREIGMMCELQPNAQPYLVLPRLMETADVVDEVVGDGSGTAANAASAGATAAALRTSYKALDKRHFANTCVRGGNNKNNNSSNAAAAADEEVPVTFGLRCATALQPAGTATQQQSNGGGAAALSVRLCCLDGGNCVFENFPRFPSDDLVDTSAPLYYQIKRPESGYAEEKTGTSLS